jgi:hypothetical protein
MKGIMNQIKSFDVQWQPIFQGCENGKWQWHDVRE